MQALGDRAKSARVDLKATLGLDKEPSQADVAAALGWSQQKYSKLERGVIERVTVDEVHSLAVQLRVDEYWLFTGRHPQPVSDLAMQIDRLDLDHWGEAAVLETARREAKRFAEQQAQAPEGSFTQAVEKMMAAGLDRETSERAARSLAGLQLPRPSTGRTEEDQTGDERREA